MAITQALPIMLIKPCLGTNLVALERGPQLQPILLERSQRRIYLHLTHYFFSFADTEADCVPKDYSVLTANGIDKMKLQLFESSDAMDFMKL